MLNYFTLALIVIQFPAQVTADKQPVQQSKPTPRPVFVSPKTPTRLSPISGRRTGMSSRNNCPALTTSLTALVPLQEGDKSKPHEFAKKLGITVPGAA